jgi:hypothetical protein
MAKVKETSFRLTKKQVEILDVILRATDNEEVLYGGEVRNRLSYGKTVTDWAVRGSIKILRDRGYLTIKMEGRKMAIYPTMLAYSVLRKL